MKLIPYFEGRYLIDEYGDILNGKGKLLKVYTNKKGYKQLFLSKNGKSKVYKIHRLVAHTYLGLNLLDSKTLACHKDDNPSNNHKDNLFVGTYSDNMKDMVNKGRQVTIFKKGHTINRKLDFNYLKQTILIRILAKSGLYKNKKLAEKFNLKQNSISEIVSGTKRGYIKYGLEIINY